MKTIDYLVLGAGLGGLSAAACLTRQGKRVVVFEQHYVPGGCCHTFDYGKYRFCADVHYVSQCGPGETIHRFLDYLDLRVPFVSLEPDCIDRVVTPEVDFRIPLGWKNFCQRLIEKFPDETPAITGYCDEIDRIYHDLGTLTAEVRWFDRKWADWLRLPKYLRLFSRRNWTLQDLFNHVGLSPKLQALLAGQSGDYALPPSEIALLTHTSLVAAYAEGAWYPKHHFKDLVDSIVASITSGGGEVLLSTPVEHIEVGAGLVRSVTAAGKVYEAREGYISDLDPKLTVKLMHGGSLAISPEERQRLTGYEYSASAFNIYLGLDSSFDPTRYGIGKWNIWYYPDADLNRAYRRQLEGDLGHPWIFLSCPTMKSREPGMGPEGDHVLEIATVAPYAPFRMLHDSDPKAYTREKRGAYDSIMGSVRDLIPDIDVHIRKKVYGTPTTSEFFLGQPQGNIYGAKLIPSQVGLNRLGYRTELPNLHLVGATAGYPSVPGVIGNGMDVAELLTGKSIRRKVG